MGLDGTDGIGEDSSAGCRSIGRIEAFMPGAASDDMKVSFEAAPAFLLTGHWRFDVQSSERFLHKY